VADVDLAKARARRWWITGRRVGSVERAGAFIADVHLALLFPKEGIALPSLWEAVAGDEAEPFGTGFGTNEAKVWAWKDELPLRGLAWYGKRVRARASLLSPALLADLYEGAGDSDDYTRAELSPDAHRVAATLAASGALPVTALRFATGLEGKPGKARFDKAMLELERHLLVTHCGVYEGDTRWPAAVIELTSRQFDVGGRHDPVAATRRFLDAVPGSTATDLARTFGWRAADANTRFRSAISAR